MRALLLTLTMLLAGCNVGDATTADDRERAAPDVLSVPTASRDAVAGESMMAPGAAVLPDDLLALDPSDYTVRLAERIPVKLGMDRFAAKDEFLVYYNTGVGPSVRVSMTEKLVEGATLFVIRRTGLRDDSVSAEESFAVFDAGVLAAYGSRVKCARGADPDAWVTELCP